MRRNGSPTFQSKAHRRRMAARALAVMLSGLTVQAVAATPCAVPVRQTIAPAAGNYSPRMAYSKSDAILQGSVSRLDLIRRQQAGALSAVVLSPVPAVSAIIFTPQKFTIENRLLGTYAAASLGMNALVPARPNPAVSELRLPSFLASPAQTFPQAVPMLPEHLDLVTEALPRENTFCPPAPPLSRPVFASDAARPSRPGSPDIFGSVALSVSRTALDRKWRQVAQGNLGSRAGPWSGLLGQNRGRDRMAQIASVNAWVNARITFVDDVRQYGSADHWASAAQSLTRGRGDCEDYAIAKMQILQALGVPASAMYLIIARDLVRQADHAILAVAMDGDLFVLDNETDRILRSAEVRDYRPILSFNDTKSWTHGYRTTPPAASVQMAALIR